MSNCKNTQKNACGQKKNTCGQQKEETHSCNCQCQHEIPCNKGTHMDMGVCGHSSKLYPMLQTYTTKVLQPTMCCGKKVLLTQQMMACEDYKYVIRWDFDLGGKTILVPENCILEFDGGTLRNGTIIGQDTYIVDVGGLGVDVLFGPGITRQGTWRMADSGGGSSSDEDRPYDPESQSGMGRVTLKRNEVGGVNTLMQSMLTQTNTVYVIKYDYVLGEDITVPANSVLLFDGGSISDDGSHKLIGSNTSIEAGLVKIFNADIVLEGTWNIKAVYPEWFGAACVYVPNTSNDTEAVRAALKFGENHKVVFSKGKTYYMGYPTQEDYRGQVAVYSNTDILIDGIVAYMGFGSFALYDTVTATPGYTGVHDVVIHGSGIYNSNANPNFINPSTPFRVHHCSNIRIEDITIKDYGMHHAMEIGGSQNVVIKNVFFDGAVRGANGYLSYAIQIETVSSGGAGGAIPYDDTISKNITVDGCRFKPNERNSYFFGAVGTLHGTLGEGNYYENITIKNCVFEDMYSDNVDDSVIFFDYSHKNTTISNNKFLNCHCSAIKGFGATTDTVRIANNYVYNLGGMFAWVGNGTSLETVNVRNIFIEDNKIDAFDLMGGRKACFFIQIGVDVVIIRRNIINVYDDKQELIFHTPWVTREHVNALLIDNVITGLSNFSEDILTKFKENLSRLNFKKTAEYNNGIVSYYDMDKDGDGSGPSNVNVSYDPSDKSINFTTE